MFAPINELERFQLDNHTTIPLGVRFGAGSRTLLLRERPSGSFSALRAKSKQEIHIDASDRGVLRRWTRS